MTDPPPFRKIIHLDLDVATFDLQSQASGQVPRARVCMVIRFDALEDLLYGRTFPDEIESWIILDQPERVMRLHWFSFLIGDMGCIRQTRSKVRRSLLCAYIGPTR